MISYAALWEHRVDLEYRKWLYVYFLNSSLDIVAKK